MGSSFIFSGLESFELDVPNELDAREGIWTDSLNEERSFPFLSSMMLFPLFLDLSIYEKEMLSPGMGFFLRVIKILVLDVLISYCEGRRVCLLLVIVNFDALNSSGLNFPKSLFLKLISMTFPAVIAWMLIFFCGF